MSLTVIVVVTLVVVSIVAVFVASIVIVVITVVIVGFAVATVDTDVSIESYCSCFRHFWDTSAHL